MHLILIILDPNEILEHVLPSLNIFVDEVDSLKLKFLDKTSEIIDAILVQDFDAAVDKIIISVFPALESMLK
jgi:hypothetical protein